MAVKGPYEYPHYYICLSTDTKPTNNVVVGDELFESNTKLWYIYDGSTWRQKPSAILSMTTSTDPAGTPTFAAVTTAIVDAYSGVIITTTTTGNAQTIQSPTVTTAGKIFTVVNNDTSTNSIAVNGITITAGEAQSFIWDGSAWGPTDLGITAIPVTVVQGGTGLTTITDHGVMLGSGTSAVTPLAAASTGEILCGLTGADPVFLDNTKTYELHIDGARADSYTEDGSTMRPFKTVLAALAVTNADVGKSWVLKVSPGTYADNITITGPRYMRIEAQGGVTLSGTILINSGVGAYDRIEFVGQVEGPRAEKGPGLTISGAMTAVRTDDSLIYIGFHGCYITGAFATTTNGTWVVQYENCRVNGAITGTFSAFTGTAPNQSSILIESYGFNEFVGTISGITALYNCNGSDFYCTINTVPEFANSFRHCTFAGAVSIIPQVGADSALIYVDAVSYKQLKARTPTITGATYSHVDGGLMIGATTEIPVGGGDGTNPVWTTATGSGAPVRATSPDIVTPTVTVPIITHTAADAIPAAQMKGQFHIVNGAYAPTLPTAAVGYSAIFMAQTAAVFSLDPVTGTDVLYLNGTALAAGNKVTSDGTIRATCSVRCLIVGFYEVTALQGLFIDGGA